MSGPLARLEAAADALADAAAALARADVPPPAGGEADRLGVAVARVHAALDVLRGLGGDDDPIHDE